MRILELGGYIIPAYAGMILAEQGHRVDKWTFGRDPIEGLRHGDELWRWINHGKRIIHSPLGDLPRYLDVMNSESPSIVIENFRPSALTAAGIDPQALADEHGIRWVSMRADVGERSFDVIAQARSWMEYGPWMPFYLGDTAAGLWLAFKAMACQDYGHFVLYHASCLQKLVEGELVIERPESEFDSTPWDRELYSGWGDMARVAYKGQQMVEPARNRAWKLAHLHHRDGRIII